MDIKNRGALLIFSIVFFVANFTEADEEDLRVNTNNNGTGSRIYNSGRPVDRAEKFPHQVSIRRYGKHVCSGTIVNSQYVATSCACVESDATKYTIVTGSLYLPRIDYGRNVSEIILHPKCIKEDKTHDIALIKIRGSFAMNSTETSLELSSSNENLTGKTCTALAWSGQYNTPTILVELTENVQKSCNVHSDERFCTSHYANNNFDEKDIGGPLICNSKLTGILSEAGNRGITIFTKVSSHYEWIKNKSKNNSSTLLPLTFNLILSLLLIVKLNF